MAIEFAWNPFAGVGVQEPPTPPSGGAHTDAVCGGDGGVFDIHAAIRAVHTPFEPQVSVDCSPNVDNEVYPLRHVRVVVVPAV